mgnify:CR=1 FL=1
MLRDIEIEHTQTIDIKTQPSKKVTYSTNRDGFKFKAILMFSFLIIIILTMYQIFPQEALDEHAATADDHHHDDDQDDHDRRRLFRKERILIKIKYGK